MMKAFALLVLIASAQTLLIKPKKDAAKPLLKKAVSQPKSLAKVSTKGLTSAMLGPFDSAADACDYCQGSYTKTGVVANCVCMAYEGDGSAADKPAGWTMFCSATVAGAKYVASNDGACRCKQNDKTAMGATTCAPM